MFVIRCGETCVHVHYTALRTQTSITQKLFKLASSNSRAMSNAMWWLLCLWNVSSFYNRFPKILLAGTYHSVKRKANETLFESEASEESK